MIAAVDIGGTKIAVGMVDSKGHLLSRAELPTAADAGYSSALNRIATMLRDTAAQAGAEITGIGIGCTGPLDPVTGLRGSVKFVPPWRATNPVLELLRIYNGYVTRS